MGSKHLVAVALIVLNLSGCAWWQSKGKDIARTIVDVGGELCELFGQENEAELEGLSPAEFCAIADNVKPFIDAALSAQQTAGAMALGRDESSE